MAFSDPFSTEVKDAPGGSEDKTAIALGEKIKAFCAANGSKSVCIIHRTLPDTHRYLNFETDAHGRFTFAGAHNNLCMLVAERSAWRIATPDEEAECRESDKAESEAIAKRRGDVHAIAIDLSKQIFVQNAAEQAVKTVAETTLAAPKPPKVPKTPKAPKPPKEPPEPPKE